VKKQNINLLENKDMYLVNVQNESIDDGPKSNRPLTDESFLSHINSVRDKRDNNVS
jgi:hypothetical protein